MMLVADLLTIIENDDKTPFLLLILITLSLLILSEIVIFPIKYCPYTYNSTWSCLMRIKGKTSKKWVRKKEFRRRGIEHF